MHADVGSKDPALAVDIWSDLHVASTLDSNKFGSPVEWPNLSSSHLQLNEIGVGHIRFCEIRIAQIDSGENRVGQIGIAKVGAGEIDVRKVCPGKVGSLKIRIAQVDIGPGDAWSDEMPAHRSGPGNRINLRVCPYWCEKANKDCNHAC